MASANSTCAANRTIDLRKGHPYCTLRLELCTNTDVCR